ncbi:MAG: hypothetical protein AAF447_13735 [Myxococcota bacterium]
MGDRLRDGFGGALLLGAFAALFAGVRALRGHDYVAALLLVIVGIALVGAGVELLRVRAGE